MATLADHVVLFGGRDTSFADLDDTWTWDGSVWAQQTPTHIPGAREFASAATLGGTVVLFGGLDGHTLSDTWTWDGEDWTEMTPAMAPNPREGAGIATLGSQVVLFGGTDGSDTNYDDTWFWDGAQWTMAATTGPSYRAYVGMCGP
jgi:hypothetical protein